jgi:holo-[acyl-carrier protein] synthase
MKQICLGIDIIEIPRIRQALSVWGDRFMRRIFTAKEVELYGGRPESLAVRFAGKEAVFKALGRSGLLFSWQDVEILSMEDGRPQLKISGAVLKQANELGVRSLEISLSHSRENAVALVMGFSEPQDIFDHPPNILT